MFQILLGEQYVELVLEVETLLFQLFRIGIGRGFDLLLDAVQLVIDLMIFRKELGEVVIAHLHLMDLVAQLGELGNQRVFGGHGYFSCRGA